MNIENSYIIPIKVDSYKDLFYEFDFSLIENRDLRDDIDSFISNKVLDLKQNKNTNVILEIYIPYNSKNVEEEILAIQAIENFYDSKSDMDKFIINTGKKRLLYYLFLSAMFFMAWYFIQNFLITLGSNLIASIFDTCATVVLWQAITLVFIERKNYNIKRDVNKIFSDMKIQFKYI